MNQFARPGLAVTELPSFNENDKGKVLKIDSDSGVLGWGESGGSGLPSTETASAGDVLSLDENKDPQWAAPSGGGGGVLVVHDVEGTLDKTWQEIWDAAGTGPAYVLISDSKERDWDLITAVLANSHRLSTASGVFYAAESANDYPVMSE